MQFLSSNLQDKGVYHSSASPHFTVLSLSLTQALIAFPRCNQSPVCMGEDVLLPLSLGFCVLVKVMSAGNMVCRRDDVAGSISRNTPGILSVLSPCQNENIRLRIAPSNVARAACCSCLRRQLSPFLVLVVSARALKLAPKYCQSRSCY